MCIRDRAITPVPSSAGFNITLALPNFPTYSWGTVVPTIGTSTKFFLASVSYTHLDVYKRQLSNGSHTNLA